MVDATPRHISTAVDAALQGRRSGTAWALNAESTDTQEKRMAASEQVSLAPRRYISRNYALSRATCNLFFGRTKLCCDVALLLGQAPKAVGIGANVMYVHVAFLVQRPKD